MLHRLRSVLIRPGRELLCGQVEVDETYIGGEEAGLAGGRAKGKKALVAVAVEVTSPKGFGRCRMAVIPDGSAKTLHAFIPENVARHIFRVSVPEPVMWPEPARPVEGGRRSAMPLLFRPHDTQSEASQLSSDSSDRQMGRVRDVAEVLVGSVARRASILALC